MRKVKKSFNFSLVSTCVVLTLIFTQSALSQRVGSAAKGGSLAIERATEKSSADGKNTTEKYQKAVEKLGFKFSDLVAVYQEANKQNAGLQFKNVIIVYIVASNSVTEQSGRAESLRKTVLLLQDGKSITGAISEGFSLTEAEARERRKQAAKSLDDAVKVK